MYKFNIPCYYWPGQRWASLTGQSNNRKKLRIGLEALPTSKASNVKNPTFPDDRRSSPRLKARCEAELIATLSILDVTAEQSNDALVFLGQTKDLSTQGVALVLPSTLIDEQYCNESNSLTLSLRLPEGRVGLEVNAVRCEPLNPANKGRGYLIGAKILRITSHAKEFDLYLQTLGT
jgi:hypothetical protein